MNWWKWPYCWTTKRIHWTSRRYICHLVACPYPPSNVECRPYGSLFGQLTGTELKRWLILLWTSAGGVAATILLSASNALATSRWISELPSVQTNFYHFGPPGCLNRCTHTFLDAPFIFRRYKDPATKRARLGRYSWRGTGGIYYILGWNTEYKN